MTDYFDLDLRRPPVHNMTKIDRIIRRHKYIILGLPLISISSCFLYVQKTPPVYESSAQILFHSNDEKFVESQTNVIRSQDTTANAALKLKPGTLNKGNLTVNRLPNSYIIQIKYRDSSPDDAANIVNAVSREYLQNLTSEKPIEIKREKTDLTEILHRQVVDARKELTDFKKQKGRAQPATFIAAISRAKEKEYEHALLSFAEAKAALHPFLNNDNEPEFNPKAPAILKSTMLHALKFKNDELQKEYNILSRRYGIKHPKIITLTTALSLMEEQIKREEQNIMQRVLNEYKAAKNTLDTFEKPNNLETIEEQQKLQQENLIILQNRLTSTEALLEAYIQNKTSKAPQTQEKPSATWIAKGLTPTKPIYPKKRQMIGLATLLSIFAAFTIAFLLEKLRPTFLSGRELEENTNSPCYALIPGANANTLGSDRKTNIIDDILKTRQSTVADAVRSLRLTLKLRKNETDENKVITVTSSYCNEGKTTLALWMARLAAKSGERVILIDANMRNPDIHKILQKSNSTSLTEYITKNKKMEDIINTDDPSGAHIIFSREASSNAIEYLSSERMEHLIRSLRKAYDLIIIDTPSSMNAPDALAVAKLSDTVLYAVRWNQTRREVVQSGISQFKNNQKPQLATVLTRINLKKHIEYGFGHSFFDYEDHKNYAPV